MTQNDLSNSDLAPCPNSTAPALPGFDWNISISFSRSHSGNFKRALFLAKKAPQYVEMTEDGIEIFQATYSSAPAEFLEFVRLYEMIANWKSAHVMINGKLTDRKIVSNIKYCYGDRCRSGNPEFCFGASDFTENPFGCHRLQISAFNNPWTDYYVPVDGGKKYQLDRISIRRRIDAVAELYNHACPVFDYEDILRRLADLPDTMGRKQYDKYAENALTGGMIISIGM